LDQQLDQLNSVLDALEQRNGRIHGQLKELLDINNEARAAEESENLKMADKSSKKDGDKDNKDGSASGGSASTQS
jgi:hypothetical protein